LLVPMVACRALLFATTSGSVPTGFRSWEDLGCVSPDIADPSSTGSHFCCMSQCGLYYMTSTSRRTPDAQAGAFAVRDWSSRAIVGPVENRKINPLWLIMSSNQLFLAVMDERAAPSGFSICNVSNGRLDPSFPQGMECLAFSPDSKTVVFIHGGMVHL